MQHGANLNSNHNHNQSQRKQRDESPCRLSQCLRPCLAACESYRGGRDNLSPAWKRPSGALHPHTEKELEAGDGHASKIWQAQKNTPPCTLDDLREADGLLFGSPTRYGNMTAQMKALIDSTPASGSRERWKGNPLAFSPQLPPPWRTRNNLRHHDDPSPSFGNAHRRRRLFDGRHDPHRSARRARPTVRAQSPEKKANWRRLLKTLPSAGHKANVWQNWRRRFVAD